MGRASSVIALALLCVLAGCSGIGGQETASANGTVTPAPVPSVPDERAAGVSEHSVNSRTVIANHRAVLLNNTYTRRTSVQWRTQDGSTYTDTKVHRVDAGGTPLYLVARYDQPRTSQNVTGYEFWAAGNLTVLRTETSAGEVDYRRLDYSRLAEYPRAWILNSLFARLEPSYVKVTSSGETIVGGLLEDSYDFRGIPRLRNERNGTMIARITPEGYVDFVAVGFEGTVDGEPVEARLRIGFSNVGSTKVSKPAWAQNFSDHPERTWTD